MDRTGLLITSDSKSNTLLSELVRHVLLRRSLNFCSCTAWFLDLEDLVRINIAWLYMEPKVSVLLYKQNTKLVQKGACWTWNQRLWKAQVLSHWGQHFVTGFFCFHTVKPLMPILAFSSSSWKIWLLLPKFRVNVACDYYTCENITFPATTHAGGKYYG